MATAPNSKFQNRFQQVVSILLILASAGMLAWLSTRYDYAADWTANRSNSLSEPSLKLLATLKGPVSITAYLYPDQMLRREITSYVERYQRHKPDITLKFIDPAKAPEKVRELDIAASGEVLVEYQGRREKLRVISEPSLSGALQRLAFSGESWVVFLAGHGERSIDGEAPADYGLFAGELRDKGLKAQVLNLARTPTLPDNTSALVIASPQSNLLPGELKLIRDYLGKGGNLLWLADPGTLAGLQPLAGDLGVSWLNGTLIYPDYQLLGTGHPAVALVMDYGQSPITQGLDDITLFPAARALKPDENSAWQATLLLGTAERSWLESGPVQE
ncbi:MAG: GldG family protein, partial [Nevskiales bacterium]